MKYLGIDISKDDFYCAFDDTKSSKFLNNKKWINGFIKEVKKLFNINWNCLSSKDDLKNWKKLTNKEFLKLDDIKIWVESTWVYHLLFCDLLKKEWFKVFVINPLITHRQIKANSLRNVKTDKTDSFAIRQSLMLWEWYLYTETKDSLLLKSVVKERAVFVKTRKELKQRIQVNNKKKEVIWDLFTSWLENLLDFLNDKIKNIDKYIVNIDKENQDLLKTIPWIWTTCASVLVAEIWDINRFNNAKQLTAYIWMDCRVHQSWTSINWKWFLTKKWNSYLRWLLFNGAFIAQRFNPDFKKYFDKKISEWKHYFSAMCAVERKLIHLIFAVWKRWTPYVCKT